MDKSIGKPTHSRKQGRHKDAYCDAVTKNDKSKIEHQFLLVHKADKVNVNFQYHHYFFKFFLT
jgi:hypothetical protein